MFTFSILIQRSKYPCFVVFLAILHLLVSEIPPSSLLSWFDLLLRPALKDTRLPAQSVVHARELVLAILFPVNLNRPTDPDNARDFRRRLFDLYLLDAFNETSEYDALEWAELDEDEQQKSNCWKSNLQHILLHFGSLDPLVCPLSIPFAEIAAGYDFRISSQKFRNIS